jgi:hypothetical protein
MCPMDNTPHNAPTPEQPMASGPLTRAVLEIDSHVSQLGWDRPAMLFALVDTAQLRAEEPDLAERIGLTDDTAEAEEPTGGRETAAGPDAGTPGGSLTPVEQDALATERSLEEMLPTIQWPTAVSGCAVSVERLVLPPDADAEIPEDPDEAATYAQQHPDRAEVRIVAGVTRHGATYCAIRSRDHDDDQAVMGGSDLVPALLDLLRGTLEEEVETEQ